MMLVKKYSGELVPFEKVSLYRSLTKSGASEAQVDQVYENIVAQLYNEMTTRKLYELAYAELKSIRSTYAARYSLKKALRDLGPDGYYFEQWVAKVFKHLGYQTHTGITLKGNAVTHEIDVLAAHNDNLHIAECKFRNDIDAKISVTTPMYYLSRMKDLMDNTYHYFGKNRKIKHGWLITNAYLTKDSKAFADYYGIKLVSWDYPTHNNIKSITDQYGLYPITTLTYLSDDEKKVLLKQGIVVVSDILSVKMSDLTKVLGKINYEELVNEVNELVVN